MSKINILDDLKNQPNEKIEAIKKILPDCFDKDGNLIAGKLKEVLSQEFEKPDTERFTFNWAGKQKAREVAYKTYTEGTLKFDKTKSKNFDETKNLIIEGDNLQVLKLLKNSYKGKVKCIYIDPPYNTGQDFVYNDKFELDIKKYLIETGEIDQETGEQMADYIQKDDGKKHSKWLSFMYPRLMVAREMLREDGVIFVSIDDNEVHHLRLLMNELFGEGEFVGQIQRKTTEHVRVLADYELQKLNDYIFIYAKNIDAVNFNKKITGEAKYELKDELGEYTLKSFQNSGADGTRAARPKLYYPIYINLNTNVMSLEKIDGCIEILPKKVMREDGRWLWSKEKFEQDKYLLEYKNGTIFRKSYYDEEEDQNKYQAEKLWLDGFQNRLGAKDLTDLNLQGFFDYPKPVSLIKHLLQISTAPNDLILDFFAGSGTTGQAVMELNQEELDKQAKDGLLMDKEAIVGGRRFILVQLPEKIDEKKEAFKANYKKISDITIERVKRAGEKYQNVDNGFKVLQLADNPDREILWNLGNFNDNDFIFTHLALLYGYGLNYKLAKIAEKEIYMMKSEIEKTKDAIVILEKNLLTMKDIMLLVKNYGKEKYKFFSRDSALNIELTYNLLQHFQEKNVVVF